MVEERSWCDDPLYKDVVRPTAAVIGKHTDSLKEMMTKMFRKWLPILMNDPSEMAKFVEGYEGSNRRLREKAQDKTAAHSVLLGITAPSGMATLPPDRSIKRKRKGGEGKGGNKQNFKEKKSKAGETKSKAGK
jgi:hypothetical protein